MSKMIESVERGGFEGGCLCGSVRYVSRSNPLATVHCYCTDCRRIGGTGHATHTVIPEDVFQLVGKVTVYQRTADSGNQINRRFCPHCGSAVFHTREGLEDKIVIRTSSMDDPEIAQPDRAIYVGSAISWDILDPDLPSFPKMSGSK